MKTYSPKLSEITNDWVLIDAKGASLGRLAALLALRLKGKHKPMFTPHINCGDKIVVVNVEKLAIPAKKLKNNTFYYHTNHPGGIKERSWKDILTGSHPEDLLRRAVKRMLKKEGPLSRERMGNLYLYVGENHRHEGQKPKELDIAAINPKNKRG